MISTILSIYSDLRRRKGELRLNNSLHSSIHQRRLASLKVWQGIATIEIAIETLKVAEYLTPTLQKELTK